MASSHRLHRGVSMVVAGVILGLAVSLAAQIIHATDELEPRPAGSEMAVIPPEENAAEWLMAGAAAVVWSDADSDAIGAASLLPYPNWGPELVRSVRDALEHQRGALATLHRAAPLASSSYGIDNPQGTAARMPDMVSLIRACRLLLAEARVAAADGDRERALIALATMGRLASSLERESSMLTAVIGIACERMTLLAAAETLTCGHPWISQPVSLNALRGALSTEDLAATMRRSWTFETSRDADSGAAAEVAADGVERALAFLSELVETPYGRAPERFQKVDRDDVPISLMVKNMSNAIARAQAALAQRQLVQAAIALRRVAITDGAFPADRSAVPELIEPDPFTGRPLLYCLREDGSAEVALDGADKLLTEIVAKNAASIPPIVLPAP